MADDPTPTPEPTPDPDPKPADPPKEPAPTPAADPKPSDGTDWKAKYDEIAAKLDNYKDISRKHERRQLEALGFDPETIEKIKAEREKNPKALAEKVAGYDDLAQRIEAMEKRAEAAEASAAVARAIAKHNVSEEDAPLLEGLTGDALDALAARLGAPAKLPAAPPPDGGAGKVGTPVSGAKPQIATREEYAALSPEERRQARRDGRVNQLLGVKD